MLEKIFGAAPNDRRRRYVTEQVYQIAPRFSQEGPGIQYDEKNCDWVMIPHYPMPARWRQRRTTLLIIFPTGYPDVPPTGFYLDVRLGLKSGEWDAHLFQRGFHGAPDIEGWHWYCLLAEVGSAGGWKPSADPCQGDGLFSMLNMIREALTVDE